MPFNSYYRPQQPSIPAVINLIIINTLVFLAEQVFGNQFVNWLVLKGPGTGEFIPYQLVTSMFAHANWMHILFNMYALWLFGAILERNWGASKFLIFYFACGLAAGLTQIFFLPDSESLGASGAIMGLLGAFAYTYPNMEFFIIPFPFAIKAKWLAVIYAGIDLFGGMSGGGGIAHFAHLGGLVTGLLLMILWIKPRRTRY